MKKLTLFLLLLVSIFLANICLANSWKQAYERSKTYSEKGDMTAAVKSAKKALQQYQSGPDFSIEIYNTLVQELASYHNSFNQQRKIIKLYKKAIKKIRKKADNKSHLSLIDYYQKLSDIYLKRGDFKKSKSSFYMAIEETQKLYGDNAYEVAAMYQRLVNRYRGLYTLTWSLNRLKIAKKIIKANYSIEHPHSIMLDYLFAKVYAESAVYGRAETRYKSLLERLSSAGTELDYLYRIVAGSLLYVYEEQEKNKKLEALWQLILKSPRETNEEFVPILEISTEYRGIGINHDHSGSVLLSHSIDVNGRVTNVKVLSDNAPTGYRYAATKALKKWRFLPRIVDSKAVDTHNVEQEFSINIGKRIATGSNISK